jgi:hypothetical protein
MTANRCRYWLVPLERPPRPLPNQVVVLWRWRYEAGFAVLAALAALTP